MGCLGVTKFVLLLTAGVFAASLATSANAEEVIKPLTIQKPVAAAKSTQAFVGLGGLGAGALTGLAIGGLVIIGVALSTSSTTGT